jgi:hypothetical protein
VMIWYFLILCFFFPHGLLTATNMPACVRGRDPPAN